MPGVREQYANKFYGSVTETAANTLTFKEIPTNVDVFSKIAWVLHRLEWFVAQTDLDKIAGANDEIRMALCSTDKLTTLALNDAGLIDLCTASSIMVTLASWQFFNKPFIRDFSTMPGGGLIIAPRPLYIAAQGNSLASAITAEVRGYFTAQELKADEYLELVDFYRIVR